MKKVAVIQSNYLPWKGYFDIIHDVDLFVFHDDLQYTKNDWRNRNQIKTFEGLKWLTVPVGAREDRLICDVGINDDRWQKKHWNLIKQHYGKATYFEYVEEKIRADYLDRSWKNLSQLNQHFIQKIARELLGVKTIFLDSRDYKLTGKKTERLIDLLEKVEADQYLSGPAAKNYLEEEKFEFKKIQLNYKDYSGYPEYQQCYPPFEHHVSILDLLMHTGPEAPYYIWGWRAASEMEQEI